MQGRGELRCERWTGRARRKLRQQLDACRNRFADDMVMISERLVEVETGRCPGTEGGLIIGAGGRSAIGTLVERSTRYLMLVHVPDGRTAEHVRGALIAPCPRT